MKLSSGHRMNGHELDRRSHSSENGNISYGIGLPGSRNYKIGTEDGGGLRRHFGNVSDSIIGLPADDGNRGNKNLRSVKSFVDIVTSESLGGAPPNGKGRTDAMSRDQGLLRNEGGDAVGTCNGLSFPVNRSVPGSNKYSASKCEIKINGGSNMSSTTPIQNWIAPNSSNTSCVIPVMPGGGTSVYGSDSTLRSALAENKPTNDAIVNRNDALPTLHSYGLPVDNSKASTSVNWSMDGVKDASGLSREAVNRLKDIANVPSKHAHLAEANSDNCVSIPVETSSVVRGQSFNIGPPRKGTNEGAVDTTVPFHSVKCNVTSNHVGNILHHSSPSELNGMSFVPNQNHSHGSENLHVSSNPFAISMQNVPPQAGITVPMNSPVEITQQVPVVTNVSRGTDTSTSEVVVTQGVEQSSGTQSEVNIARTLISTEAQTDSSDLNRMHHSTASARQNREVRKRERRERRRDRNESHCRHSTSSGNSSSHRHHPRRHVSHHNHAMVENHANVLSGRSSESRSANLPLPSTAEESHQASSQPTEAPRALPEQVPSNIEADGSNTELPDLLNSHHLPPMYSTLPPPTYDRRLTQVPLPLPIISMPIVSNVAAPHGTHMQIPMQLPLPPHTASALLVQPPSNCLPSQAQPTVRYHFPATTRASRRSVGPPRGVPYSSDEEPKSCCGISASQTVSMRWFIVVIAIIGISCTVAGTALGAAYSNGREQLTYSLLMIGVGVVLLTVSAVAWRITSHETDSSCRAMFGFTRSVSARGDGVTEPNRRFMPRLTPAYGRPHHPYAAMMYPEFQYRPPPPSYQASMQEYRLRLLLLERSNPTFTTSPAVASPASYALIPPPPAYRPYSGGIPGGLNHITDPDYSRPPSYRSRSSHNTGHMERASSRPSMDPSGGLHHTLQHHHVVLDSPLHSRNPSLLSYLSQQSVADNVSVVSGRCIDGRSVGAGDSTVVTVMRAVSVGMDLGLDMGLYDPDCIEHLPMEEDDKTSALHAEEKGVISKESESAASNPPGYNKDGNLVRIVQTTDSSQVIGRDSVIVTVSGSNHSLWSQSLQIANNHHHVQANAVQNSNQQNIGHQQDGHSSAFQRSTSSNNMQNVISNSEVQILAHL